jgi:hypothetical protein
MQAGSSPQVLPTSHAEHSTLHSPSMHSSQSNEPELVLQLKRQCLVPGGTGIIPSSHGAQELPTSIDGSSSAAGQSESW